MMSVRSPFPRRSVSAALFASAIFLIPFAVPAIGQEAAQAVPPRDSGRVGPPPALRDFPAFAAAILAEAKVPGLSIAVVQGGRVVYADGFGWRDLEGKLPATPRTIFGIGSCSKAFTSAALGILADEGKMDWDKPVRSYLPTFVLSDPVASERLTPRDLVSHRTGLPRHDQVWIRSPLTRQEMFDSLRHLEFSRDIREVYQYNNLMVMTAGYLAGVIAGGSYEAFVQARILDPLGMEDTNFSVDVSRLEDDHAKSYTLVDGAVDEFPFYSADALGPAGSINSTALDMARWVLLHLNRGAFGPSLEKRIVSERQLAQIHAPQTVVPGEPSDPEFYYAFYGLGWRVTAYRGRPLVSHGGAIMGFSAMTAFLPKDGIGIVLLNNLEDAPVNSVLAYAVIDRLLGLDPIDWAARGREGRARSREESEKRRAEREKDHRPGTMPSHPLSDYAGEYRHPAYGTIRVALEGETLKAEYHQRTFLLEHYHYDVFRMKNDWMGAEYRVAFDTDLKGWVSALSVPFEPSVKDIVFARPSEPRPLERSAIR